MSLLLQALQRAAKSREGTGQEPDAGAGPRLELEPQSSPSGDMGLESAHGMDLDDLDGAPPRRAAAPVPPPYLSAGSDYGGPSVMDYVRERPVAAFGAFALLFAVGYGIYLYLQIFHPQWLRGDFGGTGNIVAANPPPATPAMPASTAVGSASESSAPYALPPATTYPSSTEQGSATLPGQPGATAMGPSTTMGPASSAALGQPGTLSTGPVAKLPMGAGSAMPSQSPAGTASGMQRAAPESNIGMPQGAGVQQNGELASLMNLPSRQPARPAPAEAPSRLSALGNALSDGPRAVAPTRPLAPSLSPSSPSPAEPPAGRTASPGATPPPPAIAQPAPRPRNVPPPKPNLAAAKPLTSAPTGASVIELKDQVVVNAAPSQQIESFTVADAYRSWRSGRVEQARDIYREVLENEPKNVDALLGLAGIAQQQGNSQEALNYFGRALEVDPRNSSAQAGIIALTGQSDPGASESRLKQLIAREPSAFLHFTLGNLYARQSQWAQAQQSYFQAYSMNADNSDYAYNLAVSLEHIGQEKLAITYYRKAVDLSLKQGGRASFNQEQVIDRITKLSLRAK